MTRKLLFTLLLIASFALAITALADVPRPKPSPRIALHTSLEIVPDAKISDARLQMSQDTYNLLRAGLIEAPQNPTIAQRIAQSSFRTVMAGLFLFLSVSIGGILLIRSQQKHKKAVAAVMIAAIVLGAATIITQANVGPPGYITWQRLPQALAEGRTTRGGLDIEIVEGSSGIKLLVPIRNKANGEE
jgi:hypothetical protein